MKNKNCGYFFTCPPYPKYEIQPEDQSKSELVDCPHCDLKMWLSEKKKSIITTLDVIDHEYILLCYDCLEKMVIDDQSIIKLVDNEDRN